MTATRRFLIAFALLALVYFVSRAPYFEHPIIGEEGLFANLLLDPPAFPRFILAGYVAGDPILLNFNHPIAPYLWLRAAGSGLRTAIAEGTRATDLVGAIRLHFALYLFLVLAGALAFLTRERDDIGVRVGVILALAASPLAIASSVQLYLDGSIGALVTGLAALALVAATHDAWSARVRGASAAAGGLLVGLARPEWCVVYLVAAGAASLWALVRKTESAPRIPLAAAAAIGAISGLVAGYLANPENFANHLTNSAVILGGARTAPFDLADGGVRRIVMFRLWAVAPSLVMLALAAFAFVRRPRAEALAPLLFAGGLFAGYLSGLVNDLFDYRYYAPSLAASAGAWAACSRGGLGRAGRIAALVAVGALLVLAAQFHRHAAPGRLSITMGPGMPLAAYFPDRAERVRRALENDCVPELPVWSKFEFPDTDFLIPSLAYPDAEHIAAEHGRRLCAR
ncbi:MAG: hypothetical protein IT350_12755 [Deltaproteobacteria bacterium]|nr:hypothetical protein [Deltaproteobacteria bacterium]